MLNEWFFKWHQIGGPRAVEIESFRGKPICYGGIKYSGTAILIYWQTIQLYLRKKIGAIFDNLEEDLKQYPIEIRGKALTEAQSIVTEFAAKIRRAAIEKDRILRGNGLEFPVEQDSGHWQGCWPGDITSRIEGLRQIYCDLTLDVGGMKMPFSSLQKDRVTLVKKDGTILRSEIPAVVDTGQIITFVVDLPIEIEDHLLRQLPNGLVEDYVVSDPGYRSGIGPIAPHYQIKVRRTDAPPAPPQTIIANFHGPNSRMNVNSTDNSINVISDISRDQLAEFIDQVRSSMAGLPAEKQGAIAEPLAALEVEATSPAPSQSKIRSALQAMKTAVEGAASNLIASGIGALISKLIGG
jgi:hypothetical protein